MATNDLSLNDHLTYGTSVGQDNISATLELYGINHRQIPRPVPINKDRMGYVFFTRPGLNLSTPNLRGNRKFMKYITSTKINTPSYIRHMLDPRLTEYTGQSCPLVLDDMPFIPILTNHLISLSGTGDPSLDFYSTKPNLYGAVQHHVDSSYRTFGNFSISATLRNLPGSIILNMIDLWCEYMALTFEGLLSPYPDYLTRRTMDCNTAIYIFTLDATKQYIQNYTWTPGAMPASAPFSSVSDYDRQDVFNEAHKTINVQFNSAVLYRNDPIILYNFNKIVGIFNPNMRDANRASKMTKLKGDDLYLFNNIGYPRINVTDDAMALEWWVETTVYNALKSAQKKYQTALGI